MYFPIISTLRKYGNIVLWEILGMGLSQKPSRFDISYEGITNFFLAPIEKMFDFYQHKNIVMISHSFSAYLSLRYLLTHPQETRISSLLLLSPVGITPKEADYKNGINSCSDIFHTLLSKFGWTFNLTYKSPLRTICRCFKEKLIKDSFKKYELKEK
jgi:pimeloyl-ACP methyl ester carboxylesterase